MEKIYLDAASSSKPVQGLSDIIKPHIETNWQNPSAIYQDGKRIREKIEDVREKVALRINAKTSEIYFTSGASESNNWVIRGFDDANYYKDSVIITTPIEHSSIIEAISNPVLRSEIHFCKVDSYGFIDFNSLKSLLELSKGKNILVSVSMANNEIGTMQNINQISELVHSYNGVLHTDATQAFGHIPIDVEELEIDLMSASAQKMGGLKGTGFLYKKKGISIAPLIYGKQENNNRGGTENVIGIIALGEAIKNINYFKSAELVHARNYMMQELQGKLNCKINGSTMQRLSNNINVTFPQKISGEALLHMLETSNIYISTGSACNSSSIESSYVLNAIGLTEEEAARTIRITLPDDITISKIDVAVAEIVKLAKCLEVT